MPLLPSCKDREIAYYAHSLIILLIIGIFSFQVGCKGTDTFLLQFRF